MTTKIANPINDYLQVSKNSTMQKAINYIARLLKKFPINFQMKLYEIVLKYIPFWLLKRIPCSYSAYLECNFPGKGDVVFDCGAHVGNCAIIFSRLVGKTGLVISLEPFEDAFSLLGKRLQRLKLDNVIALNKGVWNQPAQLPVTVLSDSLYSRIDPEKISEFSDIDKSINVTTIDRVVEELRLKRLDMIKMDIEGAEIEALEGCAQTLKSLKPCLAVASYHKRNNEKTFQAVESYLIQKNYAVKTFFPPHLTTCAKYDHNR
jgi:FkbM family methyltransferase